MDEQEKTWRATRKVEALTGFYIHLAIFILINTGLLAVNAVSGQPWWAQWPLFGWGIGLLAHALAVFGQQPNFVTKWQLRKIDELKGRM